MINLKKIAIGIVILSSLIQASEVKLMTEIFSPYQFKDENKNLQGISIDIVRAIQKEIGSNFKVKVYPWTRALKKVDNKKNYALFSMLKTKERAPKYKWVGPLDQMKMVFFKKTGSSITINSIDDARKVGKIGVSKGVANHDILKEKGFTNLDVSVGSDDKVMKKLLKGRVDLWPYLARAGLYNAKKMGKAEQIEPIKNVVLFEGPLYIAFNKNTDDTIIKKWQDALDKLIKNKTVDKIKQKYK
ncbi:MAG: transporter substrate-binding domain-containing protein [Campylobacterota bacterium]|nr:transporter substrate-binding domain-containing protein [Campylobacterota bacterium]